VQSIRMLFEQAKRREKHRSMDAWKGAATRCRCLREHQLRVSHQRCNQTLARAIRLWEQRWSKWVRHRRSLQEFDVACWHRICRRAMDAWVRVLQLEAIAAKVRSSLNLRLQLMMFQVWVAQWHHDRKESVLLRLSALFLRNTGLKCGVRAFQRNVCSETRKRALAKAQHLVQEAREQILKVCWETMLQYSEQRRLIKLYRSWADVHWLRTRLGAAWQVWLAWHRKRGVVIAMRSGPQMLASWRWLRVHAAAHPTRPRLHLSGVQLRDGAPWQQVAAAEILYGSAPFEVHPHHMKVMQGDILMIFASTLLKKMMAAWVHEVQSIRMLFEQAMRREKHRSMDAWK
ncbi:unnamed protein product, partial [Durusdinium trenchii]